MGTVNMLWPRALSLCLLNHGVSQGFPGLEAGDHSELTSMKVFQYLNQQEAQLTVGEYQMTVRWGKSHQLGVGKMILSIYLC